nr:MAG TPA: hypothetical protein [Caudoviricetes sp.]
MSTTYFAILFHSAIPWTFNSNFSCKFDCSFDRIYCFLCVSFTIKWIVFPFQTIFLPFIFTNSSTKVIFTIYICFSFSKFLSTK